MQCLSEKKLGHDELCRAVQDTRGDHPDRETLARELEASEAQRRLLHRVLGLQLHPASPLAQGAARAAVEAHTLYLHELFRGSGRDVGDAHERRVILTQAFLASLNESPGDVRPETVFALWCRYLAAAVEGAAVLVTQRQYDDGAIRYQAHVNLLLLHDLSTLSAVVDFTEAMCTRVARGDGVGDKAYELLLCFMDTAWGMAAAFLSRHKLRFSGVHTVLAHMRHLCDA